jgi:hypothetical protein
VGIAWFDITTGYGMDNTGSNPGRVIYPGVKRRGRDADKSLPSSAEANYRKATPPTAETSSWLCSTS